MNSVARATVIASGMILGLVVVSRSIESSAGRRSGWAQKLHVGRERADRSKGKGGHDKRERERDAIERPGSDEPDQFARILNEMRIPADRTAPEYTDGYQVHELEKARAAQKAANVVSTVLPWQSRGPGNVSGRALAIVVDPDDPSRNTWFIGTAGGGIWKTTDAGSTWTELTPGFPVLSCQALALAPRNPHGPYARTRESFYNVAAVNGNGILKSTDRGANRTHLAATIDNPAFNNVARIVVDPTNPNIVLAACTPGRYKEPGFARSSIYKSTDGGTTWVEKFASTTIGSLMR